MLSGRLSDWIIKVYIAYKRYILNSRQREVKSKRMEKDLPYKH